MYKILKRVLDLLIATIALVILLPLLIPIMIILRFTGEREVFYLQKRIGYKNREFKIWKFATMAKNSENMGNRDVTLRNDPRVTKIGKYLRITKINELPQIINVLIGNMSIVGPRPLMWESFDNYEPVYIEKVYNSKPGITGIGPILLRDEEKLLTDAVDKGIDLVSFNRKVVYPYKGKVEMWYQENKSLWTDILIIFLTAWVIVFPDSQLPYKYFKSLPPRPPEFDN